MSCSEHDARSHQSIFETVCGARTRPPQPRKDSTSGLNNYVDGFLVVLPLTKEVAERFQLALPSWFLGECTFMGANAQLKKQTRPWAPGDPNGVTRSRLVFAIVENAPGQFNNWATATLCRFSCGNFSTEDRNPLPQLEYGLSGTEMFYLT
eukprot:GFKZ01010640.1.p1 GENE.GFKZ01010640.1~~GFKZ01010640.1.p1  ORF type:complete len:151 (-),score=4.81 GFKZ01010640.1:223-675(-)